MNRTFPATRARQEFFKLLEAVDQPGSFVTITVEGFPKAVMMSVEEFESWQETLEVMKDFPDLKKDIRELKADLTSGTYREYSSLERILAKEGYVLADKSPSAHEQVPDSPHTRSGERSRKNSRKRS